MTTTIYNDFKGINYDQKLEIKEIATMIKKYIKENYKELNFTLTSRKVKSFNYNGVIELNIKNSLEFKANTFEDLSEKTNRNITIDILRKYGSLYQSEIDKLINEKLQSEDYRSKKYINILNDIEKYADSFNHDYSDIMTDFFDKNFIFNVKDDF